MVFSDHRLLSGVRLCNGSLAKLRPALPIGALIFLVMVSCSNLLSLSRGFSPSFGSRLGYSSRGIWVRSSWNFLTYSRRVSIQVAWGSPSLFDESAAVVKFAKCTFTLRECLSCRFIGSIPLLTPCRAVQTTQTISRAQWTQTLFLSLTTRSSCYNNNLIWGARMWFPSARA